MPLPDPHQQAKTPFIYLNNAATSWPKPPEVIAEVTRCLSQPFAEAGRSAFFSAPDYPAETRELLAEFFSAEHPDRWVFTANATDSLNTLIHGFARRNDALFHVVTTDLEHNSVLRPLHALERDGCLSYTVVPSDPDGRVDPCSIKKAVRPETRLVVMTHGSNVLGTVQDIRTVGEYLAVNDIFFVVDGSQTAGLVLLDLSQVSLDAFVFTGHKALYGMPGTGGFWIRDPTRVAITREGGTGTDSRTLSHPAGCLSVSRPALPTIPVLPPCMPAFALSTGPVSMLSVRMIARSRTSSPVNLPGTGTSGCIPRIPIFRSYLSTLPGSLPMTPDIFYRGPIGSSPGPASTAHRLSTSVSIMEPAASG